MKVKKKRIKNRKTVLLPVVVVFALVVVYLTIEAATSGAILSQFEQEEARLIRENRQLQEELVKSTSLTTLGEKAEGLGFKKPSLVIYITEKEAVAKLP